MKLKVLNNKILVEQVAKKPEKDSSSIFVHAEVSDSLGHIVAIGEEYEGKLKPGMKIYYGSKRERIRMSGKDIEVMPPENVVAIAEDENEATKSKESK